MHTPQPLYPGRAALLLSLMSVEPAPLPDDVAALKALVLGSRAEVEHLKLSPRSNCAKPRSRTARCLPAEYRRPDRPRWPNQRRRHRSHQLRGGCQ